MFAAGKAVSGATPTDAQFNYVTMLLHGDGTNGAQNNTFLDSSTNNFSITRNGNTTQGTFSPYGSNWSNYFDGSGDYLSVTGSALDASTTTDYTVEFWMYTAKTASTQMIYELGTGATNDLQIYISTTALVFQVDGNSPTATVSFTDNSWVHVACVKAGGTLTTYINGVGTTVDTSVTVTSKTTAYIGMRAGTSLPFKGYLSNMRVTRAAVYTSNFTPSTTPLTAIANTALLTCQSNRFIDNSTNNFTITKNGDVSVQRFSPFSPTTAYSTSVIGGSGYFDGSGDYLSFTGGTATSLSSNFTIEAWVYCNTFSVDAAILCIGKYNSNGGLFYVDTSGKLAFYRNVSRLYTGSGSFPLNTWTHLVFVRQGTTFTGYINGVSQGSITFSDTVAESGGVGTYISDGYATSGLVGHYINGYISNLRLVNGTAVYTSAFTPPTSPLTAITNTSLLLSYTNAGILDNAMMNDLETVGNAQISTSVKKYGTGSMYFDGTGDYLVTPYTPNLDLGAGNFTAECWAYPNSSATQAIFSITGSTSVAYAQLQVAIKSDNTWYLLISTSSGSWVSTTTSGSYSPNNWYHIAAVRNGSTFTLYINGTSVLTQSTSSALFAYGGATRLGANASNGDTFNGYIDDLRITKGVARYTANFTAPTAPFPDRG